MKRVTRLIRLSLGLFAIVIAAAASSTTTYADNRAPLNTPETQAYNACYADPAHLRRGTIWFGNTGDYYEAEVNNVSHDATSVTVYIRGSAYGCYSTLTSRIYAIHITPAGTNAARLTGLGGTVLDRGGFASGTYQNWTTQGNQISAMLDVTGIAELAPGQTTPAVETITVGLYRCFSTDGVNVAASATPCGIQEVPVTVSRNPAPQPWDIIGHTDVSPGVLSPSQTATFTHTLTKTGAGTPSTLSWQIHRTIDGVSESTNASPDTGNQTTYGTPKTSTYLATDADVGKVICEYITWTPRSSSDANGGATTPVCVRVVGTAQVQVWGNDLRVGGRLAADPTDTSNAKIQAAGLVRNDSEGRYYGSWAEYGILAPGAVTGVASGSGLNGTTSNLPSQWSKLTFANAATDPRCATGTGCFAHGTDMGALPDVATAVTNGAFDGVSESPAGTIGTTTDYTGAHIWRSSGTIAITGNITADPGPYANERNIPQRIIIADRINIQPNVTRIDAWLIATGTNGVINTCANVADAQLRLSTCNERLVINGPVIAKSLLMRRTAGADTVPSATSAPAERFNLSASTYLWAYDRSQRTGSLRTTYVREVGVRY